MKKRIRTHANPLRTFPGLFPPVWDSVFSDPTLPFAIEWGSSKGAFLLEHARSRKEMNILGTEVRRPLVDELLSKINADRLVNAHVIWGNIAGRIRDFTPRGRVDAAYIFFPDPWPKKRHHKRRVITKSFLDEIATLMPFGAKIHVMTDHEELMRDIMDVFQSHSSFNEQEGWELEISSEWEEHCLKTKRPIWRGRFSKT